ncbi:MAG: MarR family winged helix-turn-helix transcriptional regulator [Rhodobacteraceae bacterium]|nr:MarR family winged helix-turn-helix transcriptional regulator [Paracoccaceae bacterium]
MTAPEGRLDWGPLGDSLGFLLRLAQLEAFEAYFAAMEGAAPLPGSLSILLMVRGNPGIRQGVLARALRIKRAHMTKIVQSLEQAGLLRGSVPADDRRAIELHLTPAGLAEAERAWSAVLAHETAPPATLTAEEAAQLRHLLRRYLSLQEHGHEP